MDLKSSANMNLDVKWGDVVDRGLPQEVNWQRDISLFSLFCSCKIGNALSANSFSAVPDFFAQFAENSEIEGQVSLKIEIIGRSSKGFQYDLQLIDQVDAEDGDIKLDELVKELDA